MQVRVSIRRKIVVNGQVDTFNIDTTSKNISGHANSLIEFFEFLVAFDTITN